MGTIGETDVSRMLAESVSWARAGSRDPYFHTRSVGRAAPYFALRRARKGIRIAISIATFCALAIGMMVVVAFLMDQSPPGGIIYKQANVSG